MTLKCKRTDRMLVRRRPFPGDIYLEGVCDIGLPAATSRLILDDSRRNRQAPGRLFTRRSLGCGGKRAGGERQMLLELSVVSVTDWPPIFHLFFVA
jgi:hypothetical protein